MGWLDEARRTPIVHVANHLGLSTKDGRKPTMACPACRADRRGGEDKRLPATVVSPDRWRCWTCDAWGDVVDVVAYMLADGQYNGQQVVKEWAGWSSSVSVSVSPVVIPRKVAMLYLPTSEAVSSRGDTAPGAADPAVIAWLATRLGPDPSVRARHLVRSLRRGVARPWMRCMGRGWFDGGWRALMPTWDARGQHRGWRARQVLPGRDGPKAVGPAGFDGVGLVLASPFAVRMLRGEAQPKRVIISEGEPAFLAWVASGERTVFGIGSGWWTDDHADKIPTGCEVVIATGLDKAGDRYAEHVTRTLAGRCTVVRWRPTA